jgi:DNA-binding transcriptional regulator YiaG
MKQAESFSARLRRYIMADPFDYSPGIRTRKKFRIDVLARLGDVDTDTVRYWALGQREPTEQQRDLCDIAIRSSETLSRGKK